MAGEAGTGAEAVQLARDTSADLVVMDIRMPGMDGIEATQLITAAGTHARVLVRTTFDDDDYVYGALRAGASGFMVKDMALEDILTAIRVVAAPRPTWPGCWPSCTPETGSSSSSPRTRPACSTPEAARRESIAAGCARPFSIALDLPPGMGVRE